MKRFYQKLCEAEMVFAIICLVISVSVIFISAVLRAAKHPINWGLDIALLLFTWSTFLGADIAFRHKNLVRVDMLINVLPSIPKRVLEAIVYLLMLGAIVFLIVFGARLTVISRARVFQGIPKLSYSWVTASVPVSMFFMLITACIQIYENFFKASVVDKTSNEPVDPIKGDSSC